MIVTENVYEQLETLLKEETNLIEVITHNGESKFFVYSSFEAAYQGSSTSVTYNSFKGIQITQFLGVNRSVLNRLPYIQSFREFVEKRDFINVKFSENMAYFMYSY